MLKKKRGAILSELIILVILLLLLWPASKVVGGFMKTILLGSKTPEDTVSLQNFGNLVDEIEIMIKDEEVYADKSITLFLGGDFFIAAFNSGQESAKIFMDGFKYIHNQYFRYDVQFETISRPYECGSGSCICLFKLGEPIGVVPEESRNNRKVGVSPIVLDREIKATCVEFSEDVFFYGFDSLPVFLSRSEKLSLVLPGLNALNFNNQDKITKEISQKNSDGSDGKRTVDVAFGYTNLILSNYNRGLSFSAIVHADKIEFKNTKFSNEDKRVYIFIVPVKLSDSSVLLDVTEKIYSSQGEIRETIIWGEDSGFSHLDMRGIFLSPLRKRSSAEYSARIVNSKQGYYKIYNFLEYLEYAINPVLFSASDARLNVEMLGVQALSEVESAISSRIQQCSRQTTTSQRTGCLKSYSDCKEDIYENELCKSIMQLESAFLKIMCKEHSKSYTNFFASIDADLIKEKECIDLFRPESMLKAVREIVRVQADKLGNILRIGGSLEEGNQFKEAYAEYIKFLDAHYDKKFNQEEFLAKFKELSFLGDALQLRSSKVSILKDKEDGFKTTYIIDTDSANGVMRLIFVPS
jgi:hypothetical protein